MINAVDALSAIRIDDIRVKNTFNVTITQHLNEEDYEAYNTYENVGLKTDLTIADFMGYYEKVVYKGENSFVEGFTDVIYSNDLKAGKDLQTIAKENEELLKALLHGSEFEMKKYQPLTELSSCLFSAETCGLYSIETSFLGYDTITKERLTDDEASIRAITGIMSFATLLMGWGQAGGVAEGVVIYMSMAAADSAQIATAYGCEQLGAPPLVTALISTTVGMGVGALAFKVGNTYAKPYDAGNSGVFEGINKDTSFASEMDAEDATRYRQWWDDTNSGINNHHPGMSDEDLNLWKIADERLGDEMALARVDGDAVIELRQRWQIENAYNSVGNGVFECGSGSRPTWRQSEIDAKTNYPDYSEQISFLDGREVSYGTKGSVRPDYYKTGSSVDIKNYNVETVSGRNNLANNIAKQYYQRNAHLPQRTKQSVMIDVRGQNVSNAELEALYNSVIEKTNKGVTVYFKTN